MPWVDFIVWYMLNATFLGYVVGLTMIYAIALVSIWGLVACVTRWQHGTWSIRKGAAIERDQKFDRMLARARQREQTRHA